MTERRVPAPHYVYDEATNLESFSVARMMNLITAQVVYVEEVTGIPQQGEVVEFHVLGTSVQAIVTYSSLMSLRDGVFLHIQATRIQN
ncbi:hypothetical protein GBA65_18440 [Rubrobacter marinus]|uniref:Uncharacterized protein n=1 Tax=Rubrobacter marinus TaxID=2653852 RepID=A0A6G8Q106_9ACTN|nr:hypothetical protein [Rubrobacter marinus]QIN80164.1 hypothetical protein GBA65_18440 [Rubrobacter marinus]